MLVASQWQWKRYHEKLLIEKDFDTLKKSIFDQDNSGAIDITDYLNTDLSIFVNKLVKINGSYDFSKQELILNQRTKNGPGAWIITKFQSDASKEVLLKEIYISRGFIPFAKANLRSINDFNFQENTVFGILKKSVSKRSFLSPGAATNIEKEWLYPDIKLINDSLANKDTSKSVIDDFFIQRVGKSPQGDYPEQDISIQVPSSTHFWYTIEWIFLAIFTLFISLVIQIFRPKKRSNLTSSMSNMIKFFFIFTFALISCLDSSYAITDIPSVEQKAGIVQRLGEKIDLSLVFTDETGAKLPLSSFILQDKPLIIAPVYFECPRLCTLTQEGLVNSLSRLDLKLGVDYKILSVSINPRETSIIAAKKAEKYRSLLNFSKFDKDNSAERANKEGWKFLIGEQNSITTLMETLGFKYEIDKGEFLHAAGIIVLTPDGSISRYLLGIDYPKRDFTLALVEASQGKIGSLIDQVLMFCFRYDHIKGQYTFAIWAIIRIVSIGFAVVLLSALILLKRKENLG